MVVAHGKNMDPNVRKSVHIGETTMESKGHQHTSYRGGTHHPVTLDQPGYQA